MSIKQIIDQEINRVNKVVIDEVVKEHKIQILKEQKEKEIWITTHSGKLKGIHSINTNSLSNVFCKKMSKNPNSICSRCYSNNLLKLRDSLAEHLEHNSKLLSSKIIPVSDIPIINALYFRFQSFGELINLTHFKNLMKIAWKNPKVNFALWTKRIDLVKQMDSSIYYPNVIVIYSNPTLNAPMSEVPKRFDKVFQVFTKEYAKENNIQINCGARNCLKCLNCYEFNNIDIINELVK